MALSAAEQRALQQIESTLTVEEPTLAAVFTCFSSHAERLAARPAVPDRPVIAPLTVLPSRPRPRVRLLLWSVGVIAVIAGAVGLGLGNLWLFLAGFQAVAVLLLLAPLARPVHRRPTPRGRHSSGVSPARRHSST